MSLPLLLGGMPTFFYSQFFRTPQIPTTDCTGKTIIVTGANTGLGKESARHFVRLGAAKVIIACRSTSKGEDAKRDIEKSAQRSGVVDVWPLDLADYASVQAFAKRVGALERLDVVVENAGINTPKFEMVAGNESTITINVVSTFLLALLIIPKLRADARKYSFTPTLTIVSSEVHEWTTFKEYNPDHVFDTLNDEKQANMGERYLVSKLLEVFACRQIAKTHSVEQLGCILNFVTPGWCHSELSRDYDSAMLPRIMNVVCRTTEVGSRTLVDAAIAHGPEAHGQYLKDQTVTPVSALVRGSRGPEIQQRVWDELAGKLERIQPGILKNLDG